MESMRHNPTIEERLESITGSFMQRPENAKLSIVVATGQHGNEFKGLEAGAGAIQLLNKSLQGSDHWAFHPKHPNGAKVERIEGLEEVGILCLPMLNPEGISKGSRYFEDENGHIKDMNRLHGLRKTELTQLISDAIDHMPGKVVLIDYHDTHIDRDELTGPDTHVFQNKGQELMEEILANMPEEKLRKMPIINPISNSGMKLDDFRTTLQGATEEKEHWATTLEIGRLEGHANYIGAAFIKTTVETARKRIEEIGEL